MELSLGSEPSFHFPFQLCDVQGRLLAFAEEGACIWKLMQPLTIHLTTLVGQGPDGRPVGIRCCPWPRGSLFCPALGVIRALCRALCEVKGRSSVLLFQGSLSLSQY